MSTPADEHEDKKAKVPVKWKILYHGLPNFKGKGRAEPLRLMFEDAGVPYTETNAGLYGPTGLCDAFRGSAEAIAAAKQPTPIWCPPIIQHETDSGQIVHIHNSPAIMRYLGETLGYAPTDRVSLALCDNLLCNLVDFLAEGRASFHPVDAKGTYYKQVEEAKVASAKFAGGRLKLILAHLAKWIQNANERRQGTEDAGKGEAGSYVGPVIGDKVSYADFYLFYFLDATRSQFGGPEYDGAWEKAPKAVVQYHAWFAARPRIAAYDVSPAVGSMNNVQCLHVATFRSKTIACGLRARFRNTGIWSPQELGRQFYDVKIPLRACACAHLCPLNTSRSTAIPEECKRPRWPSLHVNSYPIKLRRSRYVCAFRVNREDQSSSLVLLSSPPSTETFTATGAAMGSAT